VGGVTLVADERRESVAASFERRLSNRWTFAGTLGMAVGGSLRSAARSYDVSPGPLAAASFSYRALDEREARPFVLVAVSVAASSATTSLRGASIMDTLVSTDARLGVILGKTIGGVMTPYVAGRVFGGPIFWTYDGQSTTGTDAYHYQVGFGFSLSLGRFGAHLEVAPLGERSLAAGFGVAF
jgi:hypothetical protein